MSLTSVSSSSGTSEGRCVEALVSAPYNSDAEAARRWGVKLYFDGDVDLCNRRVRSMEEELSWTVSPQAAAPAAEEERAAYKWMDFCNALPGVASAEQLDSVPSEHKGLVSGGGRPRKLNSVAYMNDLSTTHTLRSAVQRAPLEEPSPRTTRSLGFMGKPHRRRRHSSGGLCEHQRALVAQAWALDENAVSDQLMNSLLKRLKDTQLMTSTSTFSDDLNTSCVVPHDAQLCSESYSHAKSRPEDASERHERLRARIRQLEEDMEDEREDMRKRASQQREELQRLRSELAERARELQNAQREHAQFTAASEEERRRESAAAQARLEALETRHQQELDALKENLKQQQIELYETRDKLRLAEADLVVARGEVERANARMDEQAAAHEKKVNALGRAHADELEKVTSDCEHLALSLKKVKGAYDVLRKSKLSIEEAEALERGLQKAANEHAAQSALVAQLEKEAEELRARVIEREAKAAEAAVTVEVKAKTLSEQNKYIESILARSAELQRDAEAQRETIATLTAQLKTTQASAEELRSHHVPEETSREWLDMKHTVLLQKTEIAAKNRTLETILKNLEELELEKRREDERRAREEQRRLAEKEAEITHIKQQLSAHRAQQNKLEDLIAERDRQIKEQTSEYAKLSAEVSDLKQTMKSNIQRVLNSFS